MLIICELNAAFTAQYNLYTHVTCCYLGKTSLPDKETKSQVNLVLVTCLSTSTAKQITQFMKLYIKSKYNKNNTPLEGHCNKIKQL